MIPERDASVNSDNTNWSTIAYMTPVMVRDMNSQRWERAYFVTKDNADKIAPFAVIRVERLDYIKTCWETGMSIDKPILEWFGQCLLKKEKQHDYKF